MTRDIHVLHVDDDPALRDLTAEFLERADHPLDVVSESDPTAVPDRIDAEPIDCVVSDYEMPECDGVALCRRVRASDPDLPFLLFTSRSGDEVVEEALEAGATDYVQKDTGVTQYTLLANRIVLAVSRQRALERAEHLEALAEHLPPLRDAHRESKHSRLLDRMPIESSGPRNDVPD